MKQISINEGRMLGRLQELGRIGVVDGKRTRLALSDADRQGRDALVQWMNEAGLDVRIDRVGNVFGLHQGSAPENLAPVMLGSHIDSVIDAGMYDGCYGVIGSLEVVQTLKESGVELKRPLVVGAFTNEEGVRYTTDMLGSLVYAGDMELEEALAIVGTDGSVFGEELARIGYDGPEEPGFLQPHAYVELHIEQGPILDAEGIQIGAVENLQGISWQQITIEGVANHAGTTPMRMRRDAGRAAAEIMCFLGDYADAPGSQTVATVGTIEFIPNAINVIPSRATCTVDLRNPDSRAMRDGEEALAQFLQELKAERGVNISTEQLVRLEPVTFDEAIVKRIEEAAKARGLSTRRMTSGAGHDAQMMARICPTAMIFVPSKDGISHNPKEFTPESDLVAGAGVLLDVVRELADE